MVIKVVHLEVTDYGSMMSIYNSSDQSRIEIISLYFNFAQGCQKMTDSFFKLSNRLTSFEKELR